MPQAHRSTCLAFHGTKESNIDSICTKGYDESLRGTHGGQQYGSGEYFSVSPDIALRYSKGRQKKLILNELLLGQVGEHYTKHEDIVVMKNSEHCLPRFTLILK